MMSEMKLGYWSRSLVPSAALAIVFGVLGACNGGAPSPNPGPGAQTGTFRMSLVSTANGHTYRLRHATFLITPAPGLSNPTILDSETDPNATTLNTTLDAGSYTVLLAGGWSLERQGPGDPVTVVATLTSANPAAFDITVGATTSVVFQFTTDGSVITIGEGMISISTQVTEVGGPGQLSLLAGALGGRGTGDGAGRAGRMLGPSGITRAGDGFLYVTDYLAHTIRRVDPALGDVVTIAGLRDTTGSDDGVGQAARFAFPLDLVADSSGNLYVSDSSNFTIRRIVIATGQVTTLAGAAGQTASVDGVGADARFGALGGVAMDPAGNLYVADITSNNVRRIDVTTGQVTTIAGSPTGDAGYQDGVGAAALFAGPTGLAVDLQGHLFVSETINQTVRRIDLETGQVTTIAGTPGVAGSVDGVGGAAQLAGPSGLSADLLGNLFVADTFDTTVRRIDLATGAVTTLAGAANQNGFRDAVGADARFEFPMGVLSDGVGDVLVADTDNGCIRQIVVDTAQVTTIAGSITPTGSRDGFGGVARFGSIGATFSDGGGLLYVSDSVNATVRRVVLATGEVTTIAGTPGLQGSVDGQGRNARFVGPFGLTGDGVGNLYVADTGGHTVRRIDLATGDVTTLAGQAGQTGSVDGVGAAARFNFPNGLAGDGAGHLYVADEGDNTIRRIDLATREVTTLLQLPFPQIADPRGLAADGAGNLYIADVTFDAIWRVVIATAELSLVAGSSATFGSDDGPAGDARFQSPADLASDGAGHLYVADLGNRLIRRIDLDAGVVTTLAGTRDVGNGVVLGMLPGRLNFPLAISVLPGATGVVFADEGALLVAQF
jgi:sugar lactone lactonase YvrE